MAYDTDDPNKLKLDWTNVNTWLTETNACSGSVIWVGEKIADLIKVKEKGEATRNYHMDSSIYALEQFINTGGTQLQWAE
jgi:hypothetical protein